MKVAITGASGMLGRFVARAVARDHQVVALDLAPNPDRPSVQVDVGDFAAVKAGMAGCEAVIHLAAIDQARPASEQAFFNVNTVGCWNVLLAAEELGMHRALLCSSVAALGLRPEAPPDMLPVPVSHPQRPVSAYGASKQATELAGQCFARRGKLTVVCLRPALVIFPHQLVGWVKAAAEIDGLPVPGALAALPDLAPEPISASCAWVAPEDVAEAFALALTADLPAFTAAFVTASDMMSQRPTETALSERYGTPMQIADPALYARDPRASPYDLAPTRQALGWSPTLRWPEMIQRCLEEAK
jgi:nucleoside-diphosphate-sugar epimerase